MAIANNYQVGDLEKQLTTELEEHQKAVKRAATAEAENAILKKRIAELDGKKYKL